MIKGKDRTLEEEAQDREQFKQYIEDTYGSFEEYEKQTADIYKNQTMEDLKRDRDLNNPQPKAIIRLPHLGKLISTFITEITPYLIKDNKIYYRPEEDLIITIQETKETTNFKQLQPVDLVTYLENFIIPCLDVYNPKLKIVEPKPKSMSIELAKTILGSTELKNSLPKIKTIYTIPVPILKEGKLIFPKRGYDKELESYLPFNSPKIKTDMTLEEAKQKFTIFNEFCFKSEQDKTNAIAGLLTPYIRGLYSRPTIRTPIFFYDANRERAGKDYCAGITGIVYYGENIDETPICDEKGVHDEEFRKKLLSNFRLGKKRFHSSNNKGYLNSAELEAVTTNENFTDRILGSNNIATYKNNMEFSLSANSGITYTPDLANRSIFIHLFLEVEDPNKRSFNNPDLHKSIREGRETIISCLYTFVRVWYENGCKGSETPFSSFPEWAKICGGIMETCELGDPCLTNDDTFNAGGDAETKDMKKLFELLYNKYKKSDKNETEWIFKKNIMELFYSQNTEDEAFTELFSWLDWNKSNTKAKFGKMFEKFVGRVFSNIKMKRQENDKTERRTYQFVKISDVLETGGAGGMRGEKYPLRLEWSKNVELYKGYEKPPTTPHTPQDLALSFEEVQNILLDRFAYEIKTETLISYGVREKDIQKWKNDGLIFESRKGFIKLV